jgi:hypothetical protein
MSIGQGWEPYSGVGYRWRVHVPGEPSFFVWSWRVEWSKFVVEVRGRFYKVKNFPRDAVVDALRAHNEPWWSDVVGEGPDEEHLWRGWPVQAS